MQEIWPLRLESQPYEAEFSFNGYSYNLIFGTHVNGWFLCIPNHRIGVELAHPSDRFWNQESLQHAGIKPSEAKAIANALKELSEYI